MRLNPLLAVPALVSFVGLYSSSAAAADCDCDHVVSSSTQTWSGAEEGVVPGDVICIDAGVRDKLLLEDVSGTLKNPIEVRNCGGVVTVESASVGVMLNNVRYLRFTGTGDSTVDHGFQIQSPGIGLGVEGASDNFEIDHVEITGCDVSPALRITDSVNCSDPTPAAQENLSLHDNYIHDVGREAIYFTSPTVGPGTIECPAVTPVTIPARRSVTVENNLLENIGAEGIQLANIGQECSVSGNHIEGSAQFSLPYKGTAISLAPDTACEVFGNYLRGGEQGMLVLDVISARVYNNLLADFETGALVSGLQSGPVEFLHNTVVGASVQGLRVSSAGAAAESAFANNLFAECAATEGDSPFYALGQGAALTVGNLYFDTQEAALFVDSSLGDYRLKKKSPAVDSGEDLAAFSLAVDGLGTPRDLLPDVGAYEWAAPPVVPVDVPAGTGGEPGTSTGTGGQVGMGPGGQSSLGGASGDGDGVESGGDPESPADATPEPPKTGSDLKKDQGCAYPASPSGGDRTWLIVLSAAAAILGRRRRAQRA